jgi:peptidoglycan hydrolase-like amidase
MSIRAARNTAGQVVIYDNQVIDARYSKNCGGIVEDYTAVWGGFPVPYMVPLWDAPDSPSAAHYGQFGRYYAFRDAFCASDRFAGVDLREMLGKVDVSGTYYRWHHEVAVSTLLANLRELVGADWQTIEDIKVLERGASARITAVAFQGINAAGEQDSVTVRSEYSIRQVFSDSFLYSSAFEIMNADSFRKEGFLRLRGCGWGHGAGLCQMGALGMALAGYSAGDILKHYYPGTELGSLR